MREILLIILGNEGTEDLGFEHDTGKGGSKQSCEQETTSTAAFRLQETPA